MTKPSVMHTGDTIQAQAGMLYMGTSVHNIMFLGDNATTFAAQDYMLMKGKNDQITLKNAHWTTVTDLGKGLHLALDGSTTISLLDFGKDPTGRIDLYNTGYASRADMLAHEVVYTTGTTGTLFTAAAMHGEPVLNIVGDTHVRASQIVFHS